MREDKNIDVSILIPTFNRASFIKRAIDSSLIQTYQCEVIVCDHGSTDNTQSICEGYGDKLKYIRREIDYGIHFCELEALLAANGKYIHFCFDDDWMHPEFIKICMKLMNSQTGIVFSNHEVINLLDIEKKDFTFDQNITIKYKSIPSILKIPFVLTSLISPSSALVRKKDAIDCMYMKSNLVTKNFYNGVGPDWLITAMPLFRYKKCGFISTPLVKFGEHMESITIEALSHNNIEKINKFRAAYTGARIYLLVSTLIRLIKIEEFIIQIEKIFRKIKKISNMIIS